MSAANANKATINDWKPEWFKILVIDDEPINIEILTEMLNNAGYCQIITTTDPTKALGLFEVNQPDLVLLDLQMPTMHGLEILEQLINLDKDHTVPVMILTADQSRTARLDALNMGAKDFITKPFDLTEVCARIHNLIETRFSYRNLNQKNRTLDLIVQARARALHQKHQQLQSLNKDLEDRVEQRTKELNDVNQQLHKKNDAMFDLVSVVSHEFRTPLTSIKGFAEILLDDNDNLDDESRKQFLTIINNEADRLNRLVTNLLDLQKIDAGKMEWKQDSIDLLEIISASIDTSRPGYIEQNIQLNFAPEIEQARIIGDQDKLQQVIINLLSNALKFTKQGYVTIEIAPTTQWANIILLSKNKRSIKACKKISTTLDANLTIYKDPIALKHYLSAHSKKTAIILADMESGSTALQTVEYIREHYCDLPVASVHGEAHTIVKQQAKSDKWKPLQLGRDDSTILALIKDAIGIDPTTPMYKITVTDTGIGIPENQLIDIFTRFHQVNNSETREQRGTGLGLPICEEIIKHQCGKIWADSKPNKGSVFTVLLPLPAPSTGKKRLGTILIEKGIVTEDQIIEALGEQNQ